MGISDDIKSGLKRFGDNYLSGGMAGNAKKTLETQDARNKCKERVAENGGTCGADGTYSEPGQSGSSVDAYRRQQSGQ